MLWFHYLSEILLSVLWYKATEAAGVACTSWRKKIVAKRVSQPWNSIETGFVKWQGWTDVESLTKQVYALHLEIDILDKSGRRAKEDSVSFVKRWKKGRKP
jgi:hypothetical protein